MSAFHNQIPRVQAQKCRKSLAAWVSVACSRAARIKAFQALVSWISSSCCCLVMKAPCVVAKPLKGFLGSQKPTSIEMRSIPNTKGGGSPKTTKLSKASSVQDILWQRSKQKSSNLLMRPFLKRFMTYMRTDQSTVEGHGGAFKMMVESCRKNGPSARIVL